MADITVNLSCPNCGGALSVEEGTKFTNCQYCDALMYVEGDGGIYRTNFQNVLDHDRAALLVKEWFRHGFKARDLTERAAITELYPIYLPFWRMTARAAGWVCGYEERRHTDSQGRVHTERIDMERPVLRDFDWSQIACDVGDLGIQNLRNLRGEALLHEEGSIPTFEATTSATDARAQGETAIRNLARQSAGVPNITFEKIHVIPRYLGLVFYPVWIGRYEYAGRSYFATVDGVTGQTISGRAPGDPLYRAAIMTGGSAAGGLMTGMGALFGMAGSDIGWGLAVAGIIIFGVSWMFFRHGSEVVEGDIPKAYLGGLNMSNLNLGGLGQ
jgi:hypothetical protein